MSAAANNWLKERPLLGVTFSIVGSLIVAFTVRAVSISDEHSKQFEIELESKASIELVKEYNKAAIDYVDTRFDQHTLIDQRAYNNLENIIILNMNEVKAILVGFEKYTQSIDKRLERIEDKN